MTILPQWPVDRDNGSERSIPAMATALTTSVVMAYQVMVYIVMVCIVMVDIVMVCIVIVMANVAMV